MIVTNGLLMFLNLFIVQTNNGLIYSFSDNEVGNKTIDSLEKNLTQVCFYNNHRAEDILEETRGLRMIALLDLTDSPNLAAPIVSVIEGFRGEPQVYKINGFCNHEVEWNYSVAHDELVFEFCQQWNVGASQQVEPRNEFRWTEVGFGHRNTFALDENARDECNQTIGFMTRSENYLRFTQVLSELFADPLCLVQCKTSKYRRQDEGQPIRSIDRCANCGSCTTCPNNLTASKCYGGGCQTEPDDLSKAFARVPTKPMLWWAIVALFILSTLLGAYLIYTQFNYILLFRNLSIVMTSLLTGSIILLNPFTEPLENAGLFCKIMMTIHSIITLFILLDGPHQVITEIYLNDEQRSRPLKRAIIPLLLLFYSVIIFLNSLGVKKVLNFPYLACDLRPDFTNVMMIIVAYLLFWLLASIYSGTRIELSRFAIALAEVILFSYLFEGPTEADHIISLQGDHLIGSLGLIGWNLLKSRMNIARPVSSTTSTPVRENESPKEQMASLVP